MSLLIIIRSTVWKALDVGASIVLIKLVEIAHEIFFLFFDASEDALNLLDKPLAQHLSILYQCEAHARGLMSKNEGILMLAQLREEGTNLQVHFALVTRFVHLRGEYLLDCKRSGQFRAKALCFFKIALQPNRHFVIALSQLKF